MSTEKISKSDISRRHIGGTLTPNQTDNKLTERRVNGFQSDTWSLSSLIYGGLNFSREQLFLCFSTWFRGMSASCFAIRKVMIALEMSDATINAIKVNEEYLHGDF